MPDRERTEPKKLGTRKALTSIAIELRNANRIRLAQLELARASESHLRSIAQALSVVARGVQSGQNATAGVGSEVAALMPMLEKLIGAAVAAPSVRAARELDKPAGDPEPVRKMSNGIAVEGQPQ